MVSWLNFEPRVSKLPAVSADVADTAHAIIGSLFSFNGCIMGYVSLIVVLGPQQNCGLMAGTVTMGSLFSFYSSKSKKHTKFLVCLFVLKLNY